MSKEEEFVGTYEYTQGVLNGNFGYEYGKKREALKKAAAFLSENPSITEEIFDFITFICVLRTSRYNRYTVIPFNQFTSKNAVKLYRERSSQHDYFIRKFQMSNHLRDPYLKKVSLSEEFLERQRRKYFNSPRGFLLCQEYGGYLWDEVKCKNCRYNYICKGNGKK